MLRFLRIRNLAVIESVEVEFEPGFNVLTGETGAGKSIVVEAVGLLLGGRASSDLVRTGEAQATIEAIFEAPLSTTAEPHELIIRREITSQGRSRSFINGALATAAALRDLARRLVERTRGVRIPVGTRAAAVARGRRAARRRGVAPCGRARPRRQDGVEQPRHRVWLKRPAR